MRRSILFIPANQPAMLQNASLFDADAVIFDLEDAVSVEDKDGARILLSSYLYSSKLNLEVMVRINGLDTSFYEEDLEAILMDGVDTLMVPKANHQDLVKLDAIVSGYEQSRKLKKQVKFIPIIELATSLMEAKEIASLPRVDGLLLGAEDFTADMEIARTKTGDEIFYARSLVALVCKANKIDAIDTPFTDVGDEAGLIEDAMRAQTLGMSAKACIHPNQIRTVNEVFSPSKAQILQAKQIVEASKEAKGVFSLNGKMIDKPIIDRAIKLLKRAEKFGLLE